MRKQNGFLFCFGPEASVNQEPPRNEASLPNTSVPHSSSGANLSQESRNSPPPGAGAVAIQAPPVVEGFNRDAPNPPRDNGIVPNEREIAGIACRVCCLQEAFQRLLEGFHSTD